MKPNTPSKYKRKVKIFTHPRSSEIERLVNEFVQDKDVIDVKYICKEEYYSAMVIYLMIDGED